jgi:hypothetical protein
VQLATNPQQHFRAAVSAFYCCLAQSTVKIGPLCTSARCFRLLLTIAASSVLACCGVLVDANVVEHAVPVGKGGPFCTIARLSLQVVRVVRCLPCGCCHIALPRQGCLRTNEREHAVRKFEESMNDAKKRAGDKWKYLWCKTTLQVLHVACHTTPTS